MTAKGKITCQSFSWSSSPDHQGVTVWEVNDDSQIVNFRIPQGLDDDNVKVLLKAFDIDDDHVELLMIKLDSVQRFLDGVTLLMQEGISEKTDFGVFTIEYHENSTCEAFVQFAKPACSASFVFHPQEVSYDYILEQMPKIDKRTARKTYVVLKTINSKLPKVLRKNTPLRGW